MTIRKSAKGREVSWRRRATVETFKTAHEFLGIQRPDGPGADPRGAIFALTLPVNGCRAR